MVKSQLQSPLAFNLILTPRVLLYFASEGSNFPVTSAINDVAGIDKQPGYTQVVTTDSEGNILVLMEYPERKTRR